MANTDDIIIELTFQARLLPLVMIHYCRQTLVQSTCNDTVLQTDTSPLVHVNLISIWVTKAQYLLAQFLT